MLGTAAEEIKKADTLANSNETLYTRMEKDWGLLTHEQFQFGKDEGEWESYTTNKAVTYGHRMIDSLAGATIKLWIELGDEGKRERAYLSDTERFANATIQLADTYLQAVPESTSLLDQLAFYAPQRGLIGIRLYLYEEEGEFIPDIAVWDMLNTQWISGARRLLWVNHTRYTSPEEIEDSYNIKGTSDTKNRCKIYNVWDMDEEGVIIPGSNSAEYVLREKHNCQSPPVFIGAARSMPLIQSRKYTNTIKDFAESMYAGGRDSYAILSRSMSYDLTKAGMRAKNPQVLAYDSSKGEKPEIPNDPFIKGAMIPIDKGSGQEVPIPWMQEPRSRDEDVLGQNIQREIHEASIAPVSYGEINQSLPAAGIALLTEASMAGLKPYKKLIERAYIWMAHEICTQYKNGDFGELELVGIDRASRKYKVKVSPDNINPEWQFSSELDISVPEDKLGKVGMASQLVRDKMVSRQSVWDKLLGWLVKDTDREQTIIDREDALTNPLFKQLQMTAALEKEGAYELAAVSAQIYQDMLAQTLQPQTQGSSSGVGDMGEMLPRPQVPLREVKGAESRTQEPVSGIFQGIAQRLRNSRGR